MGYPKLDLKTYGTLRKVKDDSIVPDAEWMVFYAHDNAFPDTLKFYRMKCKELGADAAHLAAVDLTIERLRTWRLAHLDRLKVPDVREGELLSRGEEA